MSKNGDVISHHHFFVKNSLSNFLDSFLCPIFWTFFCVQFIVLLILYRTFVCFMSFLSKFDQFGQKTNARSIFLGFEPSRMPQNGSKWVRRLFTHEILFGFLTGQAGVFWATLYILTKFSHKIYQKSTKKLVFSN